MSDYLSVAEVARELGLPTSAVYRMVRSRPSPFPVTMSGNRFRVLRADLDAYQREGTRQSTIDVDAIEAACERVFLRVIDPAFIRREFQPVRILPMPDTRVQVNTRRA